MYCYGGTQRKKFQGQNHIDDYDVGISNISLFSAPDDILIVNRNFLVSITSGYSGYTTSGYIPYSSLSTNDQHQFYWTAIHNSCNPCVFLINGQLTPLSFFPTPISSDF